MTGKEFEGYIATQTERGFHVVFHDDSKTPLELSFDEFQGFADKYNQELMAGKIPQLSDEEEVMLSVWQMTLIPDHVIH